jgi:hypothetical protein
MGPGIFGTDGPADSRPRRRWNAEENLAAGCRRGSGRKAHLETLDYAGGETLPPLGPSLDLFGDGSLWAISTPGHTPDHTSYLAMAIRPRSWSGTRATSDGRSSTTSPLGRGPADDVRARESLTGLRRFAARYPQVRMVFGHER